jgi:threonine/homoserine/homoserine lactone efflux protein
VLVSIFNPKVALFFLAFLPQFVAPDGWPVPYQILLLGLLYIGLALLTDGAYAVLAGHLQRRLSAHVANGPLLRYLSGSIYIGLGLGATRFGR